MKEYVITLDDNLAEVYEDIAIVCSKSVEAILEDTLMKVMDIICRKAEGAKNKDRMN